MGHFGWIILAIVIGTDSRLAAGQACQDDGHAANGFAVQRHGRRVRAVHFAGRMAQSGDGRCRERHRDLRSTLCRDFPMLLGIVFGSVSFTGSLVAFGKLQGLISEKPLRWPLQKTDQRPVARWPFCCGVSRGAIESDNAMLGFSLLTAARVGAGRVAGVAHRRRGHAGGHFGAQFLHRPGGGGDRIRHAQHVDDHRRDAGRRGGFVA